MFKFFGLKEIWQNVKKYFVFVVAFAVVFAALMYKVNGQLDNDSGTGSIYVATRSYIVTDLSLQNEPEENKNDSSSLVMALLCDSSCQLQILDRMHADFTSQEIANSLNSSVEEKYDVVTVFNEKLKINKIYDAVLINIEYSSSNKDFSEAIISYYSDFIDKNIPEIFKGTTTCEPVNNIDIYRLNNGAVDMATESGISATKAVVLFGAIGVVIAAILLVAVTLFVPPVADVKGFKEYNLNILSDKFASKTQRPLFAYDEVSEKVKALSVKKLGVVSSLSKRDYKKSYDIIKNWNFDGVEVVFIDNAAEIYDSYVALKECDAAILVESVGGTTHKNLQKQLDILSKSKVNVMGVILK